MAEDKKNEGDAKAEGKKKKGLPTIVLVAVGAILGGAGVVFAVPPKVKEVHTQQKQLEILDITHPDVVEHAYNPKSKAGRGIATMQFKFVYTVSEDREKDAFEQVKEHWDLAKSNTLEILTNRTIEEFTSEQGLRSLEKDLIDDLDRTLFPLKKGEKIARVTRVIWVKRLYQ